MKIYILHHTDMDGLCAGRMVYETVREYSDAIEIMPVNYDKPIDFNSIINDQYADEIHVYIVDFHISKESMKILLDSGVPVTMIDHHKTCMADYADWDFEKHYFEHLFIDGVSGCELTWFWMQYDGLLKTDGSPLQDPVIVKEYIRQTAPEFIRYAGDYDTWQFKYGEKGRYLNNYFYLYPELKIDDRDFWTDIDYYLESMLEKGQSIEDYKNAERVAILKKAYEDTWVLDDDEDDKEYKCIVVNTKSDSGLFDTIVDGKRVIDNYDFGVMWVFDGDKFVYSLRSRGEFDVSKVAKECGGGGHKNASGFSIAGDTDYRPFVDGVVY